MTEVRKVPSNGIELNVAIQGEGPALVLLHGFPHTWQVWQPVMSSLSRDYTVIAPDLRGLGGSDRPERGYTAADVAADALGLLDSLGIERAALIGLDLGAPAAVLAALEAPERVARLVAMEALIGNLPGAEQFLSAGPPWWFGFHAVPELAEHVIADRAPDYADFFLQLGTLGEGVEPTFRAAVREAYRDEAALAAAFAHYRALPESAEQIAAAAKNGLSMPVLSIGSFLGDAVERQLTPLAKNLMGVVFEDAGHILPQHRPALLTTTLSDFVR